jgi:hypothetical protein
MQHEVTTDCQGSTHSIMLRLLLPQRLQNMSWGGLPLSESVPSTGCWLHMLLLRRAAHLQQYLQAGWHVQTANLQTTRHYIYHTMLLQQAEHVTTACVHWCCGTCSVAGCAAGSRLDVSGS